MNSATEKRAKELRGLVAGLGSSQKPSSLTSRYAAIARTDPTPNITQADLMQLKREIITELQEGKDFQLTPEMVRDIVKMMKQLPETDRLEVQDIRNHQAFLFGGTKYGMHEMMHGGANASTTTTIYNEVVSGSGTSWTLAHTPTVGSVALYGNGQRLTEGAGNDYTISGASITTTNSFTSGTILADYTY